MFSTAVNVFEYVYFLDFECGNRFVNGIDSVAAAAAADGHFVTLSSGSKTPTWPSLSPRKCACP
jgi:hypothetical protein